MNQLYKYYIVSFLLICYGVNICGQTPISGNQSGILSKINSPYIISGNITVPVGQTWTIEPGVEIRSLSYGDAININGTLLAKGTVTDSIKFVGIASVGNPSSSHGGTIYFNSGSVNSQMEYVSIDRWGDVQGQGPETGAVNISTSNVSISNCRISNSENFGIKIQNGSYSPSLVSNKFDNNPIDVGGFAQTFSNVSSNINAKLYLLNGTTNQDGILKKQGLNSYFKLEGSNITIRQGDTLEIKPGVEIRSLSYGDAITVNGTLIAKGTAADSIKFVGIASVGNPSSSHGGTIYFNSGSVNSQLEYVSIDRWGDVQGQGPETGAVNISTSNVSISNCRISNSENFGIKIQNGSYSPSLVSNKFDNNPIDVGGFAQTFSNVSSNINAKIYLLNGTTNQDGILKKQGLNSYFKLEGSNITIRQGDTLEIKPGVEIRSLSYGDAITVNGTLIAKGTAADSIKFVGIASVGNPSSSHGGTIYFNSGSVNSQMEYVSIDRWGDVQGQGPETGTVNISTSNVSISNCRISNSENFGIKIQNGSYSPSLVSNKFDNNPIDVGGFAQTFSNVSSNINAKLYLLNGTTNQDGILKKQGLNSYFKLEGSNITIRQGDTLEIKPGVEIRSLSYGDAFTVNGTLIAKGTTADSIKFVGIASLSNPPSSHGGTIYFNSGSVNSQLEYVSIDRWGDVQGQGPETGAVNISTSNVSISNCRIRNSEKHGITINSGLLSPIIRNNTFSNNLNDIRAFIENCGTINNNTNAKILLSPNYTLSTNSTLSYPGVNSYYKIEGWTTISQTYTLTIESGSLIDFGVENNGISVDGTLRLLGTDLLPIYLVRLETPTNSVYGGVIRLNSISTNNILNYAVFDKMGNVPQNQAAIEIATSNFSSSNLTFTNCHLGMRYQGGNSPIFSGSNFYNNRIGIEVNNGNPTFNNCNIYGNSDFGINNTSVAVADSVDARNCYWGDLSGPYHPSLNNSGLGNKVSDNVKFRPIRTLPQNGQVLDIGVSTILSPITDCSLTNTADIKVRVSNLGNVSVGSFPVSYKINNGTVITENVSGASLLPGRTFDYTFTTKADLSVIGNYTISAYTKISLDSLKTNDTTKVTIKHLPNVSSPTSLIPANGSTNHDISVTLSWASVTNATGYDLFVWKSTDPIPTTPLITNINQITYTLSYGSLTYGTQYNWKVIAKRINCQAVSATQTFTTRQLPDLEVQDITVPATATSETDISIRFKIRNIGTGGTGSVGWQDVVYLTDQVDNFYVASFSNLSALNTNQSYETANFTFRIPQGIQGNYKVVVKTNYSNSLIESTPTNNERISSNISITLTPPPDLQVVAPVLVTPQNTFSEDTITINYKVKNLGTGPTTKNNWVDYIYLSQNEVLNTNTATLLFTHSNNQALIVNGEYTISAKPKLPARISGVYYVHIFTDRFDNIFEYDKNDNNVTSSLPINVTQKPTPDLVVSSPTFSVDSISNNQFLTVQWTTTNDGLFPANPTWQENIYISNDNSYSNDDLLLGSLVRNSILNSLNSTIGQQSISIPPTLQETNYYLFVKTDVGNSIYENPDEANNVSNASSQIRIVNVDLKPSLFNAPTTALSEQDMTVQWRVKNESRGILINTSWNDRVYLSSNNTFEPTDLLLGSTQLNQLLGKGAEYNKQISVTLPVGISGSYYLILVTDADNNVFEKLENNNIEIRPITISLAPWADLQVSTITVPLIDTVGTTLNIQYSLKNFGLGNISNKSWTDNIYLSPTNNVNETNLTFIGSVAQNRSIASNQTITQSAAFGIPSLLENTYYVIVKTDIANTVFENTEENNNSKISPSGTFLNVIVVVPPTPIDLSVSGGQILSSTVTAGQPVNIEWSVRNNSTVATSATAWKDAIYLSNSSILNANAELLATANINGSLAAGASYTRTATVNIPQTASGTLYLLVNTDKDNQNNDNARGNNTLALSTGSSGQAIVITIPPPADLVPTAFTTSSSQGVAAQPISVSFSIKNQGTGLTPTNSWVEQVYLSTDVILGNGNDQLIGTIPHTGSLDANATYSVNDNQIFLPSGISGNYVLILKTDGGDNVFERNNEGNNLAFANILINAQQPSDLRISDINVPILEQYAGTNTTISWNIKNIGSNTANGFKRDAVYFSKDSLIDASDVLFGILDKSIFLPNQATDNNNLTKTLTNITVGEYYVIVKTDILNNIAEINENNNQTVAIGKLKVNVKELPINVLKSDTLVQSQPLYFRVEIPQNLVNETLQIDLKGDSTNNAVNRIYISHSKTPSANDFEFEGAVPFLANQKIIIPELKAGTYYIMSLGDDPSKVKQPVTLFAKIIPFSITSITANEGGNTGLITVKITGAKFEKTTNYRLRKGLTEFIIATKSYFIDQTTAYVTFNLAGKTIGNYDVQAVRQSSEIATLTNGFKVIQGSAGGYDGNGSGFICSITNIGFENSLETAIVSPASARLNQVISISVTYKNIGSVDIPVQTRFLASLNADNPIGFTVAELNDKKQDLILICDEKNGPPGILRPGASGFFKVYAVSRSRAVASIDLTIIE